MLLVVILNVASSTGVAAAEERRTGFFDLYGGPTGLLESDVPHWKFADVTASVGARAGLWFHEHWAVSFRTWYFQTDVKQRETSPSDLAFLGLSFEILGRWPLTPRWALYGSLGPALVINTLDLQRSDRAGEDDARSLSPGVSAGAGIEANIVGPLSAFSELHSGLAYPSFRFSDRTISPRLLHLDAVVGVRVGF